jgi:single-stranded DNA-binding protein
MNGPNNERSDPMANQKQIITLFGNLGGDPESHHIPEQEQTRYVYDPVTDQVVEKTATREEREFHTFSIAVSTKEMEEPRWIRCVDWTNASEEFRKGDRVKLTGYFQIRSYHKDGEAKRIRQFVVQSASIERAKLPDDQAA